MEDSRIVNHMNYKSIKGFKINYIQNKLKKKTYIYPIRHMKSIKSTT